MWVVKIGGGLFLDPLLPDWLSLIDQLGGGRVAVVCGSGCFGEQARRLQSHWRIGGAVAHHMAVVAMTQAALVAQGLNPRLQLASTHEELRRVLRKGRAAVWLPLARLRSTTPDEAGPSGDQVAFDLAGELNAERLVLIKSAPIAPDWTVSEMAGFGVVDPGLPQRARSMAFPIDVVQYDEVDRVRRLLIGAATA